MRILHTADWHIGQSFYEQDRHLEHQAFIHYLLDLIDSKQVDVVLVSGDVFDVANPSIQATRLFYYFISEASKRHPELQMIITAGNHDSASRLETPIPLIDSSRIHIVGQIHKTATGEVDYERLMIPLYNSAKQIACWCLAVPFIRMGDYPYIEEDSNNYALGVAALYRQGATAIENIKTNTQSAIALGHLHVSEAQLSDDDDNERVIMGGVENISAQIFSKSFDYVALGHIHKAQKIAIQEHIRYSGSPIPMSFSEKNYKHQVLLFDLENGALGPIEAVEIPVSVPLLQIPKKAALLEEVLENLRNLEVPPSPLRPAYLEVKILQDQAHLGLRAKIEEALHGKNVNLCKISIERQVTSKTKEQEPDPTTQLNELTPMRLLKQVYEDKYGTILPEQLEEMMLVSLQNLDHND